MFKRLLTGLSLCGFFGLGWLSSPVLAQASHHHGEHAPAHHHKTTSHAPHVHGRAAMQMLVDADNVLVETQLPADTLFGFAHAPKTPEQHDLIQKRHKALKTSGIRFTNTANCRITHAQWKNPLTNQADSHQTNHADIQISWHYHCQAPAQLKDADFFPLFQAWPRLEQIELEWLMPNQPANAKRITPEHALLKLTP
jgi:hypothetical protein